MRPRTRVRFPPPPSSLLNTLFSSGIETSCDAFGLWARAIPGVTARARAPSPRAADSDAIIRSNAWRRVSFREIVRSERSRILAFPTARGARDVRVFRLSSARGRRRPQCDIDLLVDLGERSAGSELLEVLGLSEELSELLEARVDVVTPRTLRPEVRELALAEAVPL